MEVRIRRWRGLGRVLLFFVASAVLLASATPIARQLPELPPGLIIGTVATLGTLVLTIVFTRWEGLRLGDVGAAASKGSPLRFAIGFLFGLLLVGINTFILGTAGHVRWVRSESAGFRDIAPTLIIIVLLACREELAFRGYPLRRLNSLFGLWFSQFVVALVFTVEHVIGGYTWTNALFGAGVGSLLFGMASIATRGLAVPIGLHAAWNFGDWLRGGKGSAGLWNPIVAEGFRDRAALVGMIGYVVVTISAMLAFWWWHVRERVSARRKNSGGDSSL